MEREGERGGREQRRSDTPIGLLPEHQLSNTTPCQQPDKSTVPSQSHRLSRWQFQLTVSGTWPVHVALLKQPSRSLVRQACVKGDASVCSGKRHRRPLREGDGRDRRCVEALITTHDTQCLKSPILPGFWHNLGRLGWAPGGRGSETVCAFQLRHRTNPPANAPTSTSPCFTHRRASNSTPRRIIRSAMSSRVNRDPGGRHCAIDCNIYSVMPFDSGRGCPTGMGHPLIWVHASCLNRPPDLCCTSQILPSPPPFRCPERSTATRRGR